MKAFFKKYWLGIYGALIAVYESYHFIAGHDFISPEWKAVIGGIAFVGLILKNMKNE
jgi:hypothetical protein